MGEMDKVLNEDERILWQGKPRFLPFVLQGCGVTTLFGILWMFILLPFAGMALLTGFSMATLFLIPFFLVGLWLVIGIPLYLALVHGKMQYTITDKRVITEKGLVGRDFEYFDLANASNVEVNIGFWDKIIGQNTGSINLSSSGMLQFSGRRNTPLIMPNRICNIENPYEVFKFLKKMAYDMKTDVEYPNAYRPPENPGYK
ncbi:MAG: PH domain-containing protein, partial [Candidatus Bilamarchaeaceae archaeon]